MIAYTTLVTYDADYYYFKTVIHVFRFLVIQIPLVHPVFADGI